MRAVRLRFHLSRFLHQADAASLGVMGKVAGSIHDIKPAKDMCVIPFYFFCPVSDVFTSVEEIVRTAAERLERSAGRVRTKL